MGMGLGLSSSGGGGNSVVNKTVFVNASATGTIATLTRLLSSTSTLARVSSGSNANLTLSGVNIQATSALGVGVSQDFIASEDAGDGRVIQYKVTCTGAPVAPSVPAVTLTAGNGQISVAWTDGSNGGATITSHKIYLNGSLVASPTGASPYVVTGLTNGTSYSVQVSAVNSVGEGALSSSQSATPSLAVMEPYTLIYGFDGLGTAAAQSGSAISLDTSRQILGAGSLRVQGRSINTNAVGVNTLFTTNADMSTWKRVAMYTQCGRRMHNPIFDVRPASTPYAYRLAPNANLNTPYGYSARGGRWTSWYWPDMKQTDYNGTSITTTGTANKTFQLSVTPMTPTSAAGLDVSVDALIRVSDTYKPKFVATYDDANVSQYNRRDKWQQYGLRPTLYVPHLLVDSGSGKYTLAQLQELANSYGWGVAMDSEGTDKPLTAAATVDDAIAALLAVGDQLVAWGLDPRAKKHFCYSYGGRGIFGVPLTYTVTSDGGAQSILNFGAGSTNAYSYMSIDMRCRGTGVPAGTKIIRVLDQNLVQVDQQVTAGSRSVTFYGRAFGLTVTADGSNVFTVNDASNLFVGMHMFAYGVPGLDSETPQPGDTRITAISGNTVTVTPGNNVPSSVLLADFGYADSPWWMTRLQDRLIAPVASGGAGILTGRFGKGQGNSSNAIFSGYGFDPYQMIEMYAMPLEDQFAGGGTTPQSVTDALIAQIQMNVREGRDTICYGHQISDNDYATGGHYDQVLSVVKGLVDAGQLENMTIAEYGDWLTSRVPIS